ncbi:MAG: hypothetical protein M0R66_07350 [Candidatus Omnitrophica bacterium]|jgi:hypothetical protein|nr:hypothetical protein [Candidatus Omnitrophota bacterium]
MPQAPLWAYLAFTLVGLLAGAAFTWAVLAEHRRRRRPAGPRRLEEADPPPLSRAEQARICSALERETSCLGVAPETLWAAALPRDPLEGWPAFQAAARRRLEAGRSVYGDRSFALELPEGLAEILEELLDAAAWSFIAWSRLTRLRELAGRAGQEDKVVEPGP